MSLPLYKKIKNIMFEEISELSVNDPIPSERVLAELYEASRMTVRKALDELVEEGYLYRDAKRGTFVADRESLRKNTLIETMVRGDLEYRVLYFDVRASSSFSVHKALHIRPTDQVVRMTRLVSDESGPFAIEEIYVERRAMSDEEVNNMTKWQSFNRFMTRDNVVTQRFVPSTVPVQYARLLKMKIDSPILVVENFISNKMGERLVYTKIYHNPAAGHIEITA